MGLSREQIVARVDDAYGWTDLQPDSVARTEAYDHAEGLIKAYQEAVAEEEDAASRAAALLDDLQEYNINPNDLL